MATKTKRIRQDGKRVSNESHEVGYTGTKVAKQARTTTRAGKRAVTKAKQQTRTVSRKKVERRAVKIAR